LLRAASEASSIGSSLAAGLELTLSHGLFSTAATHNYR
jgi:hypothetical protein